MIRQPARPAFERRILAVAGAVLYGIVSAIMALALSAGNFATAVYLLTVFVAIGLIDKLGGR